MTWLMMVGAAFGIFGLVIGGKYVVQSGSRVARSLRISEYVLSFILIAFATSIAELAVGINSAFLGVPDLSLGDVLGTNIVNLTLIIGLVAVVSGTVTLRDYAHFKNNRLFELTVLLAPLILLLDGTLSRLDGLILLALFGWNIIRLLDIDDKIFGRKVLRPTLATHAHGQPVPWPQVLHQSVVFMVSMAVLIASTYMIVVAARDIASWLDVPTVLIGVLVIATCTSLPELTVGIRSALQGRGGLALGDILGASTINATLVLGLVAVIHPITIADTTIIWTGIVFITGIMLLLFFFLHTKHALSRWEGLVLIGCYVLFVFVQIFGYF